MLSPMEKVFVIGGMGSGKSTVCGILADAGLAAVDLDALGHEALCRADVREGLVKAFGEEVLGEDGQIDRARVAARAFADDASTARLNDLTHPHIARALHGRLDELERQGWEAAVVELSAFAGEGDPLAAAADVLVAVRAPRERRVERAASRGFAPDDVRRRIARQPSDEQLSQAADVVFDNDGDVEALRRAVLAWWSLRQGGTR